MKTIILAGGFGTRISEETEDKPKPMVLIDDKPILWHVMNIYASQGFNDFIIAAGYKADVIEKWVKTLDSSWKIVSLDTGLGTMTGGRIKKCIQSFPADRYFVTYGDGVGNVDLKALLKFHLQNARLATVTAVRPPARFGVLDIENGIVKRFGEKSQTDSGWINGGFFVIESQVHTHINGDDDLFETGALAKLTEEKNLSAYQHNGFWKPMDTLREKRELQELASLNTPPWLAFSES
jgi:glucose-1-phosphate cytidylyltransferase